ncbi:MAG: CHAT domain-containing tetratricopeptide repeat protein [Pseudomonadota bacterium]
MFLYLVVMERILRILTLLTAIWVSGTSDAWAMTTQEASVLGDSSTSAAEAKVNNYSDPEALARLLILAPKVLELLEAGKLVELEPAIAEFVALRIRIFDDADEETLSMMAFHGTVLLGLAREQEAIEVFDKALPLALKALGRGHSVTLSIIKNRPLAYLRSGQLDYAITQYEGALAAYTEELGPKHRETLIVMGNYVGSLLRSGRLEQADAKSQLGVQMHLEALGPDDPATLLMQTNRALVLKTLGRFSEAELIAGKILRRSVDQFGEENPNTLIAMNLYATTLDGLSRLEEAEELVGRALVLQRKVLGKEHPLAIETLAFLGTLLLKQFRPEEAEPVLKEAVQLYRKVRGDENPETLLAYNNYAENLRFLGRSEDAERALAEILQISRRVLGEDHPSTLLAGGNYAVALDFSGRFEEAAPYHLVAVEGRRALLGDAHPDTLMAIGAYAFNRSRLAKYDESLTLARELIGAVRQRAATLDQAGVAGKVQGQREFSSRRDIEQFYANMMWLAADADAAARDGLTREVFTTLQFATANSTSRAVQEAAAVRFASGQGLEALVKERQQLLLRWKASEAQLVESRVSQSSPQADRDAIRSALVDIEARIAQIDAELAIKAPEFFAILNQTAVSLEEAQSILGPDEAVLFLVPTDRGLHAMALTNESTNWVRMPVRGFDLITKVTEFREGLEVQPGDQFLPFFDLELAHELYNEFFAPIEPSLNGRSRVYVVADGPLSRVPLGTLIVTKPPAEASSDSPEDMRATDWLADRYALVQLPSLQSLYYIRTFGGGVRSGSGLDGTRYYGFGDPVLEGKGHIRGSRSAALPPLDARSMRSKLPGRSGMNLMDPGALRQLDSLPGTRAELTEVRDRLGAPGDALFLGPEMVEPAIRSVDFEGTNILHLATHGITSEASGDLAEPGLVFTPPRTAGLDNDGYLGSSEVVSLDLSGVRWVILSACNTASPSGQPGESGLSGLAQAFFFAGAQSLLVSHWPVYDRIAPRLTIGALERSLAGQPRAEALQATIREIRNDPKLDADHPAVWGPFTLVGEGK